MKVMERLEELGRWFLRGCCLLERRDGGGSQCGDGCGGWLMEEGDRGCRGEGHEGWIEKGWRESDGGAGRWI